VISHPPLSPSERSRTYAALTALIAHHPHLCRPCRQTLDTAYREQCSPLASPRAFLRAFVSAYIHPFSPAHSPTYPFAWLALGASALAALLLARAPAAALPLQRCLLVFAILANTLYAAVRHRLARPNISLATVHANLIFAFHLLLGLGLASAFPSRLAILVPALAYADLTTLFTLALLDRLPLLSRPPGRWLRT
jgi:hypothetical protein